MFKGNLTILVILLVKLIIISAQEYYEYEDQDPDPDPEYEDYDTTDAPEYEYEYDFDNCVGVEDDTYIGVPDDCSSYLYCDQEVGYPGSCGNEFWSFSEGACVPEDESDCVYPDLTAEPEETTTEITTIAPDTTTQSLSVADTTTISSTDENPTCPTDRPNEIVFLPSKDCEKYFICFNENIISMSCSSGLHWNQADRTCDYPANANCTGNINPAEFRCPPQGDAILPHPTNCNQFIYCLMGTRLDQLCPISYLFDTKSKRCVFRNFATCLPGQLK